MADKPPPPTKFTAETAKAPPAKPKGIKGWGRSRVGVGVPVKVTDESAALDAWAAIKQRKEDEKPPEEPPPVKAKGWGRALKQMDKFRAAQRKELLSNVYLPPARRDEMAKAEEEANRKVAAEKTDGHAIWDFRGGEGFEEGDAFGKGTGVDGVEVANWFGAKEEALQVSKVFMGRERKVLKPPEFKVMMPRLYIASTTEAEMCDQTVFRARGITHILLLGMYKKTNYPKTVQLRIATQDVDTYNLYTHLEKVGVFIDEGRALGKVLLVDHNGKAESLAVFCATLMRIGFTFDDAERIMRRRIPSGRLNYGFVSQLRAYVRLPHISHLRIPQDTLFEIFPELKPPAAVLSDLGKPLDTQFQRTSQYPNIPEPSSLLEDNAHLGYGTGGGMAEFVSGIAEALAAAETEDLQDVSEGSRSPSPAKRGLGAAAAKEARLSKSPVKSPEDKGPGVAARRTSVTLNEAQDWVELFDMNTMKIYYHNTLTGKTRWTMPQELKKLKEEQAKAQAAAAAADSAATSPVAGARPGGTRGGAGGPSIDDDVRAKMMTSARRHSKASVDSHTSKISETSRPSAYKTSRTDVTHSSIPRTQRSKLSAKQLEERRKNKHLLFKYFRLINEWQVSPTSSRLSSVVFRDDMVVTSSDFDGNVKFSIWKSGILLSWLRTKVGLPTHKTWCLNTSRSKAYGKGTSDWLTVSFSGEVNVWRDPIDTDARMTSGNAKMPTLVQQIGAISAFEDAPPAHGLSHLCCSATVRQDRVYILVVTESGHLLEYTRPESEWDNSGCPMTVPITRMMYTPDERYIVTAGMDGSVRLWSHVFKERRAIPEMHAHRRFNEIPLEKNPRPKWKFGAVTCMDISLDSKFILVGYMKGGLIMVWEADSGKPWMKLLAAPEKSVGNTQADRVRQAQEKAKAAAKEQLEMKKRMRGKSNPSAARSASNAFLTGGGPATAMSNPDTGSFDGSSLSGSKTPTVLGEDGRPLDDPMSRSNAAYSELSFSDDEEDGESAVMTTAPSVMQRSTAGMTKPSQDDLPKSTKEDTAFTDWEMSVDSEGKFFAITGCKFSHNQKFIVISTSTGWIQLYSTRSARLVCQSQIDAEVSCIAISPNDCFVTIGMTDGRAAVFEIQEQMMVTKSACSIL